jgi:hypothetical protein
MKNIKQKEDWENEIGQIAPWLPLDNTNAQPIEPPSGYFEALDERIFTKIKETSYSNQHRKRLITLLSIAAGFLLVIIIGKNHWFNLVEKDINPENSIYSLSEEEASQWLKEEAIISEVDLQLYVEGLTASEEN